MASKYNPYSAINAIYNLKGDWDKYNKSGDTQKKNKAAENAKAFYNQLRSNGYGNVADQLSSVDVSGAKYILDQYSTKNSGVDNQAYSTSMQNATNKNNTFAGYIDSDRKDVQGKYNDIYNYANQDLTKTDEYQSTFKNMMGKYDMAALQGRDNAVASGGASNGGNIDSYAASNAMRQQASLTAQGQQIAHMAGLEAANARVANVTNILNNLGVYNSGTYDAMNQTVNNDLNIANSYFTNAETAKNNEVARLSEQANVTGNVPKQWQYSNNPYFNSDGTLNSVYTSEDFDNTGGFTTIINNAKAKLATTTDATEKANLQATINYATQAKAYKTLNNPQYAQYAHEVAGVTPQQTEGGRQFDKTMDYNYKALDTGSADTRYATDAEVQMNADANATQERMLKLQQEGEEKEDVYGIEPIDMTRIEQFGVDEYGQNAIKSVIDLANDTKNAGVLTKSQIISILVSKSGDNKTNKNQLEKVSKYLGIGVDWLENIEDVNSSDWTQGVKYKK